MITTAPEESYLGHFPDAELVFGIVCPLGTEHRKVVDTLRNYLDQFGYTVNCIRLTDHFADLVQRMGGEWNLPLGSTEQAKYKIAGGNKIREISGRDDFLALMAAGIIAAKRTLDASWDR